MTTTNSTTGDLPALVERYHTLTASIAGITSQHVDIPDEVGKAQRQTAFAIAATPADSIGGVASKAKVFWAEAIDGDDLGSAMTDASVVALLRSIMGDIERLAGCVDAGADDLAELIRRHDAAMAEGKAITATGADLPGEISDRQLDLERAILATPAADLPALAIKAAFVKKCQGGGLDAGGDPDGDVKALIADIKRLAGAA